jgi:hypothetical protein
LSVFLALIGVATSRAGTISGSYSNLALGSNVNLTSEGAADWVHWGLVSETSLDRRMLVPAQISDYSLLAGADLFAEVFQYADNWNGYSWTNGTPSLTASNSTTGVWAYSYPVGEGTGFQIAVPADTRLRILKVYVGVYSGQGEINASLSDSSASPYVDSSLSYNGNGVSRAYVINYAANSAGQSLRVNWTLKKKQGGATQSPNVTLQAAALITPGINIGPGVALVAPSNTAQFSLGQPITFTAIADDADGSVTNVSFFQDDNKIGEVTNSPYEMTWLGAPAGQHKIKAVATDNAGETNASSAVEIFVYGTGGYLSGSVTSPPPLTVDLTSEGSWDWIHWGLISSNSVNHKTSVTTLITNYARFGTNPVQRFSDGATSFLWSDGNPTASNPGSPTGIFVYGRTNGFKLSVPASSAPQLLKLYAGLYGAQIRFRAYLSDASAPAFYGGLSNIYETVDATIPLQFHSASTNQLLIVDIETQKLLDPLYGNVRLMAASLRFDNSILMPFALLSPMQLGSDFVFSFDSQSNYTYHVENFNPSIGPPWSPVLDLPGTGGRLTVTNPITAPESLWYRVRAQ